MAEHQQQQRPNDPIKNMIPDQVQGASASKAVAFVTLLPLGGFLLLLSGLTLAGTLIGLALSVPVFVIFSPVLVPAAVAIGLAVAGFLTSGAFGITGLSSLAWIAKNLRMSKVPEQLEHAKRRVQDTAGQMGQKAKEMGQTVTSKAQETGKNYEGGRGEEKKT